MIGLLLALPLAACGKSDEHETKAPAGDGFHNDVSVEALDSAPLMRAPKPVMVADGNCEDCGGHDASETLGARAADATVTRGKGSCDAKLQYGNDWAQRMPPEFPVYPKAQLQEAAGIDGGICDLRVASFTTLAPMQDVIDYYYTRARKSGFDAEHQIRAGAHVLGGTRDVDGGAYFITFATGAGKAINVDIVTNKGR